MKLVNFDTEAMAELLERGFTHALLRPITSDGKQQHIADHKAMEVIPFRDFADATSCLDKLPEPELQKSIILEMTGMLSKLPTDEGNSVHLLIDIESAGLKESYHN